MPKTKQQNDAELDKLVKSKLLELSEVEYITPQEIVDVIVPIAKNIGEIRKESRQGDEVLDEKIKTVDYRVDALVDAVNTNLDNVDAELLKIKNKPAEWGSKQEVSALIDAKLPAPTDLDPLYEKLQQVEAKIKPFPKQEVPLAVWKEFDAIQKEIEDMQTELKKKQRGGFSIMGNRTDVWVNGSGQAMGKLTVSSTQPANPAVNDLWVQT